MSENGLTLLFTFFLSVDDSHHSKFHETTRGEEDRMTLKAYSAQNNTVACYFHMQSLFICGSLLYSVGHGSVQDD